VPSPPTAISTVGMTSGIYFSWTPPTGLPGDASYELFEHTSSTPFSSATLIWSGNSSAVFIAKPDTTVRYYWVRVKMPAGGTSTTEPPVAGAAGSSNTVGGTLGAAAAHHDRLDDRYAYGRHGPVYLRLDAHQRLYAHHGQLGILGNDHLYRHAARQQYDLRRGLPLHRDRQRRRDKDRRCLGQHPPRGDVAGGVADQLGEVRLDEHPDHQHDDRDANRRLITVHLRLDEGQRRHPDRHCVDLGHDRLPSDRPVGRRFARGNLPLHRHRFGRGDRHG
jgi:hypothetical protein